MSAFSSGLDQDDEVLSSTSSIEDVFSGHWFQLADYLTSEDAKEAVNSHLTSQLATASVSSASMTDKIVAPTVSPARETPKEENRHLSRKEYWDERFIEEEEYDWLGTFKQMEPFLKPYLESCRGKESSILVIGCGNSSFSPALYDAGYMNITNIDYSNSVITRMYDVHKESRKGMKWLVHDMTDLQPQMFDSHTFDIVIDKAGMDSIMTTEGDVWTPSKECIEAVDKTCKGVSQLMYSTSLYLMFSFQQPHFRTRYLSGYHADRLATSSTDALDSTSTDADTIPTDIGTGPHVDASTLPWFLQQSEQDDGNIEQSEEAEESQQQREEASGGDEASFVGASVLGHSRRYGWNLSYDVVKSESGSFENFLYVMRKL